MLFDGFSNKAVYYAKSSQQLQILKFFVCVLAITASSTSFVSIHMYVCVCSYAYMRTENHSHIHTRIHHFSKFAIVSCSVLILYGQHRKYMHTVLLLSQTECFPCQVLYRSAINRYKEL